MLVVGYMNLKKLKINLWLQYFYFYICYICRFDKEKHKLLHIKALIGWFWSEGDINLRLNYPNLNSDSIVFDVGSYLGDFSYNLNKKYNCTFYLFEPYPEYAKKTSARFSGHSNFIVKNYGLSNRNGFFDLNVSQDGSSFSNIKLSKKELIKCEIKNFAKVFNKLNIKKIDLIKINIEGDEYDLLDHIIKEKLHLKIINLQIQFHNFVPNAVKRRNKIIKELSKSHELLWSYDFVWENWKKID